MRSWTPTLRALLLRLQATGRKTFYYAYNNAQGKRKRIKIGVYGSDITVRQARDQAEIYAGRVAKDGDVQADKANDRQQARLFKANTLAAFLDSH